MAVVTMFPEGEHGDSRSENRCLLHNSIRWRILLCARIGASRAGAFPASAAGR